MSLFSTSGDNKDIISTNSQERFKIASDGVITTNKNTINTKVEQTSDAALEELNRKFDKRLNDTHEIIQGTNGTAGTGLIVDI